MPKRENLIMASVLAIVRGEATVRGIAERFGVTEAQVRGWRDVFVIAGTLGLAEVITPDCADRSQQYGRRRNGEPTTECIRTEPTTTPQATTTPEPTTTPDPTTTPEPTTTTEPTTTAEP